MSDVKTARDHADDAVRHAQDAVKYAEDSVYWAKEARKHADKALWWAWAGVLWVALAAVAFVWWALS